MPLAHSADNKRGIPPQDYASHVNGVVKIATKAAHEAAINAGLAAVYNYTTAGLNAAGIVPIVMTGVATIRLSSSRNFS